MKIALFTYSTQPRGSVIHTLELAEALHHLGHQVCIYALDKDGKGFDYLLSCRYVPVPTQPAASQIDVLIQQRIGEFVDFLSSFPLDYDCYHAQDCISANALAQLVEQQQIPHFIRTVHHIEDYSNRYLQHCQDRSIRAAKLCLCVSQLWQTELQRHYQITAPRVINGVNLKRFSPILNGSERSLKAKWGLHRFPIYLTVGGIEPRKNSIALLQAFALVLQTHPNAQLVIAGGATLFDYQAYRNEFFALADRLEINIGQSLVLPGVVADAELPALYRCVDAFVFPSLKEGWGLVVLEAIASGLPIITTNQTPFTEFLSDTQALLIDPKPDSIAQSMRLVIQPELSRALVQQSQSVLSCYTWDAAAKMHLHHYSHFLSTPSRSYARNPLSNSMV